MEGILTGGAILLGAAGLFLAAELAARVWIRRFSRRHAFVPGSRQHFKLDLATLPRMEAETRFEVNGDGVRSGGGRRPRRGDTRMLVAGGSGAEGFLLDWPSSWAGVAESELNRPENLRRLGATRVHMGSVGRSRTATYDTWRILEELLPRYGPLDAVILMVGASDVVEWLEAGAPACYEAPTPGEESTFRLSRRVPLGWKPATLALYHLLKRLRERFLRPVSRRENVGGQLAKVRQMRARAAEIIEDVPDPSPMLDHFERHLRLAVACALRHARRVLLVRQPCFWKKSHTREEATLFWDSCIGNPYHTETTRYYSHQLVPRLLEQANDRAEAAARDLGARVLDVMPYLPRDADHYYDFFHFTPAGARIVGTLVAEALTDRAPPAALYTPDQDAFPVGTRPVRTGTPGAPAAAS